jgi:gliding motility-associated-like protein
MPDNVCAGQTRHYSVDPNPVPGSTYTWWIDGVVQAGFTTNEFDHTWNNASNYLLEVQELSQDGCPGPKRSGQVFVRPEPGYLKKISDFNGFNISCYGLSNGSVTLNPTSELTPFTFGWSGPDGFSASTQNISGLIAGQYTIIITDKNKCTSRDTFNLIAPKQLGMSINSSVSFDGGYNIGCAGKNTGSLTVSSINSVGLADILWNDGFKGNSRSDLYAGTYKIIITDANNCQADTTVTLTEPDQIKITLDMTRPFCPDKPDGEIRSTVTGGIPGTDYILRWSDNSSGRNISNIGEGNYKLAVNDHNGCTVKDSLFLSSLNETCLIIPNAISPNGDLINDVWNIGNIDLYPNVEIKIYNNWGELMWKSERGYPRPWNGRSNGAKLPIDSYFYMIDLHNGSRPVGGSVTIIK